MQRYRVIVLGSAIIELEEIITYISTSFSNHILAASTEEKIWNKIIGLEYMPERNKVSDGVYCVHVKSYIVYYTIRNNDVLIFAIRHRLQRRNSLLTLPLLP